MIGPPIGVLPRKTIAWRARTRPRIDGSARSWTMAVDAVMNVMLATPTATPKMYAKAMLGAKESAIIDAPKPSAATVMLWIEIDVRRAESRAPASEPMLKTEYTSVNVVSLPWNVRL